MSITKEKAWVIFRADRLGHEEAAPALDNMTQDEFYDYSQHADDFDYKLAQIGIEAQNEAAAIMEAHPHTQEVLGSKKPWELVADDYWALISQFKGSKFERLHLSAMFGQPNSELLLELVKP